MKSLGISSFEAVYRISMNYIYIYSSARMVLIKQSEKKWEQWHCWILFPGQIPKYSVGERIEEVRKQLTEQKGDHYRSKHLSSVLLPFCTKGNTQLKTDSLYFGKDVEWKSLLVQHVCKNWIFWTARLDGLHTWLSLKSTFERNLYFS